jgi:FtsP/CotA-like multicopper oxidase with cupredoxin domain
MSSETSRRSFLAGTLATTGLAAGAALAQQPAQQKGDADKPTHEHMQHGNPEFPRQQPGQGGPVGTATDRGKLVAGLRAPGPAPVPVETPDLPKLGWKMIDGVKEFHLVAKHTRREFLPGEWMHVWGYNDSMPGPTIEAVEGDRVRIVLHNELPESTVLHLHGLELANRFDGVHGLTQDPVKPGMSFAYELTLHQNGTFFYHSHGPMQEGLGMAGLFIIHPRSAYQPAVDHDFALLIQEWAIMPLNNIPNVTSMEFNWFTLNGRSAPYITPLVVRLGSRVRIRMVNMSAIDHHPMHLHGHTFWVTGTEAGRIPDTAWVPRNNVLIGVAQAADVEFIANNPGDWMLHCHMFHHMMNHMTVMVGPMGGHARMGMPAGANAQSGMGMTQGGPALSEDNGPSMGRAMGENTGNERAVRTGPQKVEEHAGHGGSMPGMQPGASMPGMQHGAHGNMAGARVPGFPADMMDMPSMMSPEEMKKIEKPLTRGMRKGWADGAEGLMTIVRVLPADLYDKVVSGKGNVMPGASVPGSGMGGMPGMHDGHQPSGAKQPKDAGKPDEHQPPR